MMMLQQKGLEKGLSGLENVSGSVLGGLIGGGKPDVKNVMNVVSVSQKTAAQFLFSEYSILFSLPGQSEGGWEELVPEAVRGAGVRPGPGQAVLPRGR